MIVLWKKLFIQKCFSTNGMTLRNPKKIWEKRVGKGQVLQPNRTSWDKFESWDKWDKKKGSSLADLSWTSGTRRRGSWDLRGTSGTRTRGLSTWTIPLVPNGSTRPCNISTHLPPVWCTSYRPYDVCQHLSKQDIPWLDRARWYQSALLKCKLDFCALEEDVDWPTISAYCLKVAVRDSSSY